MKELNINIAGDEKTLIVREGKALELKEPLVINIEGDINSVKAFIAKRYINTVGAIALAEDNLQAVNKDKAVIIFDKSNLTISLEVNPQDFYGPKVKGELEISDEIEPWKINEPTMFNRESLVKLIRFNKRFFSDAAKHDEILKAFQTLSITGSTEVKATSDTRGNKNAQFDKKLNTDNIPSTFYLEMPIYKGLPARKFLVEVCIDSAEHSVQFWFESVELKEIQDKIVDEIFTEQKELFADFVIINK